MERESAIPFRNLLILSAQITRRLTRVIFSALARLRLKTSFDKYHQTRTTFAGGGFAPSASL